MAVSIAKDAIKELNLPLIASEEVIRKIIGFYDEHALQKLTRR
jgi:hypothetical protein